MFALTSDRKILLNIESKVIDQARFAEDLWKNYQQRRIREGLLAKGGSTRRVSESVGQKVGRIDLGQGRGGCARRFDLRDTDIILVDKVFSC